MASFPLWRCGLLGCASLLLALAGCVPPAPVEASGMDAPPIDSARVPLADALAWPIQRSIMADLDADGAQERLVVAADVMPSPDGVPLWEDGHRWAVWVVAPEASGDSSRTQLYGAFVPMGRVDVSLTAAPVGQAPRVLMLKRTASEVATEEVQYVGPGEARSSTSAHYPVQRGVAYP